MGKIYIVGFGPGNPENMTEAARRCLQAADVIVGYTGYTKLLRPLYPEKNFHETGMMQEIDRCRAAIGLAKADKTVCVVSSGDSGVYGMASLIFEMADGGTEIKVVPGVTAALSGAAALGAPLSHDFAVISLSDLLTPWETIEKRLRSAAMGDFVICIYNPGSKTRTAHLRDACDILLETLPPERQCGIAANIGRAGELASVMSLAKLRDTRVGMTETVFIGNSQTRIINGRMVTPRGYHGS